MYHETWIIVISHAKTWQECFNNGYDDGEDDDEDEEGEEKKED